MLFVMSLNTDLRVHKSRPKSMNEIASQEQAVQVLKKALTSQNVSF